MCEILTVFLKERAAASIISEFSEFKSAVTKILGIQDTHTQTRWLKV